MSPRKYHAHRLPPEYIFVAHGFLGSPIEFLPLKVWLEFFGYRVELWGHATLFRDVDGYSREFSRFILRKMSQLRISKIHLLGHSMGAIIARATADQLAPSIPRWQKGKMVLLAPPNRGSHVAGFLSRWLGTLVPAISDLSDHPSSYVNQLSRTPPLPTGIVWTKYDHMVQPSSVTLPGIADTVEVGGLHTTMLFKKKTARLVDGFLKHAKFNHIT